MCENCFHIFHKELIKNLHDYQHNSFISETDYTLLRPHSSNSPAAKFYGFSNTHKNNISMHCIVPACATATFNSAKFITKILQNDCAKTSSFVRDSTDFIQKIKHLSINPEEETLLSFDVSAPFTSISVPVALQVINSKISACLISPCLQDPYRKIYHVSGNHYHQLYLLLQ